ncbi:MAG: MFS transporter [Firmicutes bacterium]|nr:MFS transporter [Bacillota bacterium]
MSLVAHWFAPSYRGRAGGVMIIGSGLGIVASGLLVPWLNANWVATGWRIGWAVFGITVLIAAALAALFIRNRPREMGLDFYGGNSGGGTGRQATATAATTSNTRVIVQIGALYFMFGCSYVIYATFIVTTLVEQYAFTEARAGLLWMAVGILSIFSGVLFGGVSDRFGRRAGLISVFVTQTVAYVLVASESGQVSLLLSMLLFGISAFSIPAIMAATVSDILPPVEAGKVFGYVTFFFAIGQITGPAVAGYLAEISQSFTSSYWLAAILTGCAIGLAGLLRPPTAD